MKQIKFTGSIDQSCDFLVTLFVDGTVEVEQRRLGDNIWSPIRGDLVEVIDTKEESI